MKQHVHDAAMENHGLSQTGWLLLLGAAMGVLVLWGVWFEPQRVLPGLLRIGQSSGLLISDYIAIGGMGAALVNAGLVGLSGLFLAYLHGVSLSGPVIAGVFTMAGFGFFGKNWWSIWPIILGVALFGRLTRRPFKSFILVAMFGTALAPLVTQVAFGFGWGVIAGCVFGILGGFLLPPLAVYMLRLHQGYNIYNVGLTCGFLGLFITAFFGGMGLTITLPLTWSEEHSGLLSGFLLFYMGAFIVVGLVLARGLGSWRSLLREAGTLPTDFVALYGAGTTLINMGVIGLVGWGYVTLVGGQFNGPTLGGIFTMVGFAAFGKHLANVPPIMIGVYLSSWLFVWEPAQPGPLLAALFATTLAPLSGRFGPLLGILAGVVHSLLVMRTASWHGGLNLYNNGFAGGLTATLFVGIISWWLNWREERRGAATD